MSFSRFPHHRLRTPLWAALLLTCSVQAQTTVLQVNLPAQSLDAALQTLASQSGAHILYVSELTEGRAAPAVQGTLSLEQALQQLLAGTGLTVRADGGQRYTIVPAQPGVSRLEAVQVTGALDGTTEGSGEYLADHSTSATRLALSGRETPQSVSVITRQRLDDQGALTLSDALRQATGVKVQESEVFGNSYEVRGYALDTVQVDGVPMKLGTGNSEPALDMAIYDRAEMVRGAAGLLQGAGNPGGSLNLVRKMPTRTFAANATVRAGSWHSYRVEGDVGGPLNAQGTLRGRVVAAYDDRDSFIDYVTERKHLLYGVLQYDLTPTLTATVGVDHQRTRGVPQGTGLVFFDDGGDIGLPRSTYLGAEWNHRSTRTTRVFGQVEWRLEHGWRAKAAATRETNNVDLLFLSASGQGVDRDTGFGPRLNYASASASRRTQTSVDAYASGPLSLFGRTHELVVGANLRHDPTETRRVPLNGYSQYLPDVYNWDPSSVPPPDVGPWATGSSGRTRQSGIYTTARIDVADPLKVILGARWSWWNYRSDSFNYLQGTTTASTQYEQKARFTPYAGVVLDLDAQTSLYASYTDIFRPQYALDRNGDVLRPIVGANYEVGVKRDWRDGKLSTTLALFRIDETNRAQTDLDGPSPCPYTTGDYCSIAAGKVRSQGVEMELAGELAPGWNLTASHTYNTTKYLRDRTNQGNPFNTRTPRHMVKLFTTYRLPGSLQAWTVGGGFTWQTDYHYSNSSGSIQIDQPSYAVADLMLRYQVSPRVSATLNVGNLFDKRYYRYIAHERAYNYYGEPRNVMLTLQARY